MMRRFAVAAARRCHAGRLPQWHADRAQHRTVAIVSIATATTTTARQSRVLRGRFDCCATGIGVRRPLCAAAQPPPTPAQTPDDDDEAKKNSATAASPINPLAKHGPGVMAATAVMTAGFFGAEHLGDMLLAAQGISGAKSPVSGIPVATLWACLTALRLDLNLRQPIFCGAASFAWAPSSARSRWYP